VHRRRAEAVRLADEALAPRAERARRILDARARSASRPLDAAGPEGETLELVAFGLAGSTYLIESRFVREVLAAPAIVPVPRTPRQLVGIVNLRGELAPVYSLALYYGLADAPAPEGRDAAVLGERRPEFAILVDWIAPAERMPASSFHQVSSDSEIDSKHVRGITVDGRILLAGDALIVEQDLYLQS
jgi:purine-binding chemotaxis protein CheW